jgi:hypothetical protein
MRWEKLNKTCKNHWNRKLNIRQQWSNKFATVDKISIKKWVYSQKKWFYTRRFLTWWFSWNKEKKRILCQLYSSWVEFFQLFLLEHSSEENKEQSDKNTLVFERKVTAWLWEMVTNKKFLVLLILKDHRSIFNVLKTFWLGNYHHLFLL